MLAQVCPTSDLDAGSYYWVLFFFLAMTVRMQRDEQERTADLVKEHSKQMLELLAIEQNKIRQEMENEIVSQPKSDSRRDLERGRGRFQNI